MTDAITEAVTISDRTWRLGEALDSVPIQAYMAIATELRSKASDLQRMGLALDRLADDYVIRALGEVHD